MQPPPDALDDEPPEQPPLLACPMFRLHGNMLQALACQALLFLWHVPADKA